MLNDTELRKALYLELQFYYSKRIQMRTSHRKRSRGQNVGGLQTWIFLSSGTYYPPGVDVWWHAQSIANLGSSLEPLVSRVFIGARSHAAYISLQPFPEVRAPLPPTVGTGVLVLKPQCTSRGQSPRQTKTLVANRTFQRPSSHLPVVKGKGQTSLWVKLVLLYTVVKQQ